MDLVMLVLVLCLKAEPTTCQQIKVDWETPMECLLHGQQQAALWLEDHPRWRLVKYRCMRTIEQRI